MALDALAALVRQVLHARSAAPAATLEYPLEEEGRLYEAHSRAPVAKHLEVLLGDYRIGGERFIDLFQTCMQATGTVVTPFNVFQRYETRAQLCRYLLTTLDVPGARAECGVYRGASALLLCHAMRSRIPGFRGEGMHLIDSFSGTSESTTADFIPVRDASGETDLRAFFTAGKTDTSAQLVHSYLSGSFPDASIHAGWIPEVFGNLLQTNWAYVHLDLTLYEPTLAGLEYFYPRLSPGGVILCDGSIFCPGAEKAVRQYCDQAGIAYAVLAHREHVLIKDAD